jgi:hypothetical protein
MAFFRRVEALPRSGHTTMLDDSGNQRPELGHLWAEDRASFAFDNRDFVVALSNMPIGDSHRFFGRSQWVWGEGLYLRPTMRLADPRSNLPGLAVATTPGRNALALALPPLASMELLPDTWQTLAHELGHAFGLGDEYVDSQSDSILLGDSPPNPNLDGTPLVLNGDRTVQVGAIKWNWHRIRKASVITRPIVDRLDGTFRVLVAKGRGFQFARGDFVRLRRRERRAAIGRDPPISIVEFKVEEIHATNLDAPQDPFNMTIVVRNEAIGIDVTPFGPGSLVYLPVAAPAPVRSLTRPYLTLVSPAAERIMAEIGGTMSGKDCDPADVLRAHAKVLVPRLPLDRLTTFAPLASMPRMVGVYFGGATVPCSVVRPTGACLMRTGISGFSIFCPVCQYALVERIDPEQHSRLDRDFEAEYTM